LTSIAFCGILAEDIDFPDVIKPILTAAVIALSSTPALAVPYDDTVTFSASAVCAELTGTQDPTNSSDEQWSNYLKCIQVLNYFNTKYN